VFRVILLSSLLAAASLAASGIGDPEAEPSPRRLNALLQAFADRAYGEGFRELGQERDCDHGHLLYASGAARPFAVLYHTQELAPAGVGDASARNWLQWTDSGLVEDARLYLRASYPKTAYWDWFKAEELPRFKRRRTIVPQMLDPALLGRAPASIRQWLFARSGCGASSMEVRLPGRGRVCLTSELQ
jgi:hypothetical protein